MTDGDAIVVDVAQPELGNEELDVDVGAPGSN
jgi:hypothetical protein